MPREAPDSWDDRRLRAYRQANKKHPLPLSGSGSKKTRSFRLTAPEPSERDVHVTVAKMLDRFLVEPAFWFCYPAGASVLSPQQAARHIELGLKRGLPDIWIMYHGLYLIELKRPGGKLSKTREVITKTGSTRILEGQEDVFPRLMRTCTVKQIAVCYDAREVMAALDRWGIPHLRGEIW